MGFLMLCALMYAINGELTHVLLHKLQNQRTAERDACPCSERFLSHTLSLSDGCGGGGITQSSITRSIVIPEGLLDG